MATEQNTETKYKCCYCSAKSSYFKDTVTHVIECHHDKELKVTHCSKTTQKIINFQIIPDACYEQGRRITINDNLRTIHLSRVNVIPKESPHKKKSKYTHTHNEDHDHESIDEIELSDVSESKTDHEYEKLIELLPNVVFNLRECGKLDEFVSFSELLATNRFPTDNIAFLLFLDVVKWFSLEQSTTSMRYSDNVKLFWRTGMRLFKGRFLRFMGGPKNCGQIINNEAQTGKLDPMKSAVNFVVPNRKVLSETSKMVPAGKPGLLHSVIDMVAAADGGQDTYKICVDGKRINPTSCGEVDLWGHEHPPSFEDKQIRLTEEQNMITQVQTYLHKLITLNRVKAHSLYQEERKYLGDKCRCMVTMLSCRIRDLRQSKLGKDSVLMKLQKKCEGDWRESRYSMVISSIRTHLHQIDNCLEDFLTCNEQLCKIAAELSGSERFYTSQGLVNLQNQANMSCLSANPTENDPPFVKQRSETWFQIRDKALTTGSTISTSIGLQGLKNKGCISTSKLDRRTPKLCLKRYRNALTMEI